MKRFDDLSNFDKNQIHKALRRRLAMEDSGRNPIPSIQTPGLSEKYDVEQMDVHAELLRMSGKGTQ